MRVVVRNAKKWYQVDNNLTQAEFAELLGVTKSAVSLWALGKCKPRKDRLYQIAELFDTDVETLTGDNMDNNLKTNGSGYYDPTAYTALREAIKKEREKRVQVLRGDIFYIKKWGGYYWFGTVFGKTGCNCVK